MALQSKPAAITTVDAYLESLAEGDRKLLQAMRDAIREEAPEATETMSYGMSTYRLRGNLVHFAAFRHHIGFYPGAGAIAAFSNQITGYEGAKGALRLPKDQPLPLELIRAMTRYRVQESISAAPPRAAQD